MGCFSFMCKVCGKAILSNSFRGQRVKLFLLKEGKVIQEMEGEYDSYGRVFSDDLKSSIEWKDPFPEEETEKKKHDCLSGVYDDWSKICSLMFSENKNNGIAAIHTKCFTGKIPTERSKDDPNQGWGEDCELFADYEKGDPID